MGMAVQELNWQYLLRLAGRRLAGPRRRSPLPSLSWPFLKGYQLWLVRLGFSLSVSLHYIFFSNQMSFWDGVFFEVLGHLSFGFTWAVDVNVSYGIIHSL